MRSCKFCALAIVSVRSGCRRGGHHRRFVCPAVCRAIIAHVAGASPGAHRRRVTRRLFGERKKSSFAIQTARASQARPSLLDCVVSAPSICFPPFRVSLDYRDLDPDGGWHLYCQCRESTALWTDSVRVMGASGFVPRAPLQLNVDWQYLCILKQALRRRGRYQH